LIKNRPKIADFLSCREKANILVVTLPIAYDGFCYNTGAGYARMACYGKNEADF
jgi:hypothetical protein